ncbi:MAG: hypothetical protein JGK29_23315 [Microcoleus sp. PH2017_17_BER_D_A]|nr:hypothetical protein [Microcoleus sp. PH2017_17_BER_D_A]
MTQNELEALVDELGLVAVVSLLATICHNKARQTLCLKAAPDRQLRSRSKPQRQLRF